MIDWGYEAEMQFRFKNRLKIEPSSATNLSQPHFHSHVITKSCCEDEDNEGDQSDLSLQGYSHQTGLKFSSVKQQPALSSLNDNDDDAAEISLLKKILRTHLLETTADVEILRRKCNSPLYSLKSFEDLHIPPNLLKGIYSMGYNAPSKIQELSLPTLLANPPVNMIAQAQSGTGKTAAFLLACFARINTDLEHPQVMILSPTFELALQIGEVARQMAKYCSGMSCRILVKNEKFGRNAIITEQMLVGTPGKVVDLALRCNAFDMKKIVVFVFDEADVMISTQGHQDQCIRIYKMLSEHCQILLFSATYTEEVIAFAEQIVPDPIIIRVKKEEETLENVLQYYIICKTPELKYIAIRNIYSQISIGQTIIFCATKLTACWLGNQLNNDGHTVGYLSSDLNVMQRNEVISSFREGKEKVLITTNVCARGIDIEQVTMVINYDLPLTRKKEADFETYLHRIGRTGRFGKTGMAVNLVTNEHDMKIIKDIQEHFGKQIRQINADDADDLETMNL